jgi:SAM-dependent methyltransferase
MKQFWDQRYSGAHYYYGVEPNSFFREQISGMKPGWLFLPAEGEGRNAVYAAGLGWQVTAADYSHEGRKKALALARANNVGLVYHTADLADYDFGKEKYDLVALIYLHLMPDERKIIHQKAMRSLKHGGTIILEAFSKKQIGNDSGGPKSPEMLFSLSDLQEDFAGMEIRMLEEATAVVDAGEAHQGQADLIRLIAFKP